MIRRAAARAWATVEKVASRVPLWYVGACYTFNCCLLFAALPSSCSHQTVVDAGTAGARSSTGGTPAVATGGTPATGGSAATGGAAATGGKAATGGASGTADACELAGQKLTQLNCTQQATPKGIPFATACRNAKQSGLNWHPECIAKAKSCVEVPALYRGCK